MRQPLMTYDSYDLRLFSLHNLHPCQCLLIQAGIGQVFRQVLGERMVAVEAGIDNEKQVIVLFGVQHGVDGGGGGEVDRSRR